MRLEFETLILYTKFRKPKEINVKIIYIYVIVMIMKAMDVYYKSFCSPLRL